MSTIHVVINPASGARKTESIWQEEVRPLLDQHSSSLKLIEYRTESEGDGARIGKEIIDGAAGQSAVVTVVLLGGDGTTHEVLNGIVRQGENGQCEIPARVRLALVPTGTANALYASLYPGEEGPVDSTAYRTKNVQALLASLSSGDGDGDEYPLALTNVTTDEGKNTIAHLITSHALHASILADSEALRSTHPGIERFKIASAQNVTRWTSTKIKLHGRGSKGDQIQRYDADTKSFKDIPIAEAELAGPIHYFVCVTTDRLEPTFVPAPLSGPSAPTEAAQRPSDAVDILLIRPLRDPTLASYTDREASFWSEDESQSIRDDFASKRVGTVVGGMYDKGKHIDIHYDESGHLICEYYRCAGYEWTPLDDRAKRTCIDGTVLESSLTTVRVLTQEEGAGRITVCK